MKKWQKVWTVLTVCGLAAGVSLGATIRYRSSGDWTLVSIGGVGSGWQEVYPTTSDIGRGNWGNNLVTLTTTESIGAIQWGVDEASRLVISGTGNLTTGFTNSCGMGYGGGYNAADSSKITIESGGVLTVNTNWNMGWTDAGIGGLAAVEIQAGGTMTVTGEYIQNSTKVVGSTKVSGTLNVGSLTLGNARILNIDGSGKLVIARDATVQVEQYIAAGTLLGNSSVSNVLVAVTTNEITGVTNTTVTAKLPAVPDYVGLYIDVATAKVVADGFTVGTVSSSYLRGIDSGNVLSQNPLAGNISTPPGSPIDLTHQEIAPETIQNNDWTGGEGALWNASENWSLGDAPLRETQHYYVRVYQSPECVLDTVA
ncbi:MAG: PASTA domain-containing protein, partial [Pontiellaceae bacterium]|nr:PASTA domain-containing protein [Pontiellaceae bacterium]